MAGSEDVERAHTDTTLTVGQKSIGFNARVEPFWHSVTKVRGKLNLFGYLKAKWKAKKLLGRIDEGLWRQKADPNGWDRVEGDRQCNLKVAKLGMLQDLREHVARRITPEQGARLVHFLQHREWHSYYIPVDFPRPFSVRGDSKGQIVPIGSSVRLEKELGELNAILRLDRAMDANKMVAYLNVSERDIFKYETNSEYVPDFWVKFGYVILKKLCEVSVQKRMPIIFS